MSSVAKDIESVFIANFPASQVGQPTEYKLVKADDTLITDWTNIGVLDKGEGAYSIALTLDSGAFVIKWRIPNTPYVANEDINVLDFSNQGITYSAKPI